MTDLYEHGRPFTGCPDCDPPMDGRMLAVAGLLVAMVILVTAFAIAWQVAS